MTALGGARNSVLLDDFSLCDTVSMSVVEVPPDSFVSAKWGSGNSRSR